MASEWGLSVPKVADSRGLIATIANARAVVTWRVHGALAALALGRPALLFGTDSRHITAWELGAQILDDRCVSTATICEALDRLLEAGEADAVKSRASADAIRVAQLERIRGPLLAALH